VNEGAILAGHFESTRSRFAATDSPLLILHDTTEFTFARNGRAPVGLLQKSFRRKGKKGRPLHSVVCGILMHPSLAITPDGLPLGLAAIKFWNRRKFKGTNALKRKVNLTRVPIEEKAFVGWKMFDNRRRSSANHSVVCTLGTGKVTSMNCSVRRNRPALIFCCELVWTAWPKRGIVRFQR
jgi:hypothetical protein